MGCGGGWGSWCKRVESGESRVGRAWGNPRSRRFAVAVALQTTFVSFAGGYRHRSAGLQVVLADHDDGDRERVVIVGGMVDEAVRPRRTASPHPELMLFCMQRSRTLILSGIGASINPATCNTIF